MRRILALFLVYIVSFLFLGPSTFADENTTVFISGKYKYKTDSLGNATIISYIGSEKTVIVPDVLDGHIVTGIGNLVFGGLKTIISVNLPESLQFIDIYAFSDCSALTSVSMPSNLQTIGHHAFYNCIALKSIRLPDGIKCIDHFTFTGCSSLSSISLPDSIETIGDMAFAYCTALEYIGLPKGLKGIGKESFAYCDTLVSVGLPEGLQSIHASAFSYCPMLTYITLPNSLQEINRFAFWDCDALTLIVSQDSYAQKYAEDVGIPYQLLSGEFEDNCEITYESIAEAAQNGADNSELSKTTEQDKSVKLETIETQEILNKLKAAAHQLLGELNVYGLNINVYSIDSSTWIQDIMLLLQNDKDTFIDLFIEITSSLSKNESLNFTEGQKNIIVLALLNFMKDSGEDVDSLIYYYTKSNENNYALATEASSAIINIPNSDIHNNPYHQLLGQYLQFYNLANTFASIPSTNRKIEEVISIQSVSDYSIVIQNNASSAIDVEIFVAGLKLQTDTLSADGQQTVVVPWDGTDYEYIAKEDGVYLSGKGGFTTSLSQATKERGLFFDSSIVVKNNTYINDIVNDVMGTADFSRYSMLLHGVDIEILYSPSSLPFEGVEVQQFLYMLCASFHRNWELFGGYLFQAYTFVILPIELSEEQYVSGEGLASVIFTTDVLEDQGFRPEFYCYSIAESMITPFLVINIDPHSVWLLKSIATEMSLFTSSCGISEERTFTYAADDIVLKYNDIPLEDGYQRFKNAGNVEILRYLYIKPLPILRAFSVEYCCNTGKSVIEYYNDMYTWVLLNNPNFNPRDPNCVPYNITADVMKEIFIELTQNEQMVDDYYEKYAYHGAPITDIDPEWYLTKNFPHFLLKWSGETELMAAYDEYILDWIKAHDIPGFNVN